jgi:2-polyprenyl-3-methyl-5-hydroxy-6-metoxy-1,4-benzoquinol methylase
MSSTLGENNMTAGTQGYENFIDLFVESSREFDFHMVCSDFKRFLPAATATVLDIGSGAGQNAAELSRLGYRVTAVEPMTEFLDAAKEYYENSSVRWLLGSLPELECLDNDEARFEFVLINGVWHHLDEHEREQSVMRISKLINTGGKCAISLRNGPAGMGTRVFPTSMESTIDLFQSNGFGCVFSAKNMPSVVQYKKDVCWSRVVFSKA